MKKEEIAETREEIVQSLKYSYARWDRIYANGSSDPFWADGTNLNLVRNHIVFAKKQCEERFPESAYPKEYYFETPPEMDDNYMVRSEEIRAKAEKSLDMFRKNESLKYLRKALNILTKEQAKETRIRRALSYEDNLEECIRKGDLVCMRRYDDISWRLEKIDECREEVEAALKDRKYTQMTIFDFI